MCKQPTCIVGPHLFCLKQRLDRSRKTITYACCGTRDAGRRSDGVRDCVLPCFEIHLLTRVRLAEGTAFRNTFQLLRLLNTLGSCQSACDLISKRAIERSKSSAHLPPRPVVPRSNESGTNQTSRTAHSHHQTCIVTWKSPPSTALYPSVD